MSGAFRITQRSIGQRVLTNLQGNLNTLGSIQDKLSSGKEISKPSDSPTGTVQAMQLRGSIRREQQYSRNISDGLGWLGTIDSALTSSSNQLQRVRNLVVQGSSTGSQDASARQAIALEINAIRDSLIGVANTQYVDRPVFGGTTAGGVAYDSTTNTWVTASMANTEVYRTIADSQAAPPASGVPQDGSVMSVSIAGDKVFNTKQDGTGTDLFTLLSTISSDLTGDTTKLSKDLGDLDGVMKNITGTLADVGARTNRLEQMQTTNATRVQNLTSQLSDVEDIDLPKTLMDLSMRQTAYQAALGAASRVVTPSLIDFLR